MASGAEGGSGKRDDRTAPVWAAAGAASEWEAAAHDRAALSAYGRAWTAKAGVMAEMVRVAESKGLAAGEGEPVVGDVMAGIVGAIERAALATKRAAKAFRLTLRRSRAAAGAYGRAAEAYERAGRDKRARAARRQKKDLRRLARSAADWVKETDREVGMLAQEAGRWKSRSDAWAAGKMHLDGSRAEMRAEAAQLREGAGKERAKWAELAEAAAGDEREAAGELERAAAAAERAAARAEGARKEDGAQEAAAALDSAMAAAKKAAGGGGRTI